jgi:hypothetical protein
MSSEPKTAVTTTTTTSDASPVFQVNQKKMKELAENANAIKIGGKVGFLFLKIFDKKKCFVYVRAQLDERRKLFIDQLMQMIKNFKVH